MKTPLLSWLFLLRICYVSLTFHTLVVSSQCPGDQQSLLLQLKNSLTFDPATSQKLVNWNNGSDYCSWEGVSCKKGCVSNLDLSNETITGGLDNSSPLFGLKSIENLNLADNNFNYTLIPSEFKQLTGLTNLNLSNAGFAGQVPIEISHLTRLVTLDLSTFYFGGTPLLKLEKPNLNVLLGNFSELVELYLDGVNISAQGTEWCQAISSSLPKLRALSLSNCSLSGPIDSSLLKLQSLSVIRLDYNHFSIQVPEFFSKFPNLTSLHLSASCWDRTCSGLYGTFPEKIFQVPTLQTIDLSGNRQLQGSLPEFPKNASLRSLVLSWANFSGLLPNSIGNLKMLSKIDISGCNFTGSIPSSIEDLHQLVSFDLSGNKFNGSIPSFSMANNLTLIDLSYNQLTGQINSTHWENLTNLVNLDLRYNLLDGTIPSSLFSLPMLQDLELSNNQFSGQLLEFGNFSSLHFLDLSSNSLEGPIPMSIFNLRELQILSLSSNNFSGSFPFNDIQQLKNLSSLDLTYNLLDGTIPSSLFSLPMLQDLYLSNNHFSGQLPEFGNFSSLYFLDLSRNSLEGPIPMSIFNLRELQILSLSSNNFSGSFPFNDIQQLKNLSSLDLTYNLLDGTIPSSLFSLPMLQDLELSNNHFSGQLPEFGNFSSLDSLDLSSNSLEGPIPMSIFNLRELSSLSLSSNNFSGSFPLNDIQQLKNLWSLDLSYNSLLIIYDSSNSSYSFPQLFTLKLAAGKLRTFPDFLRNQSTLSTLDLSLNQIHEIPNWIWKLSGLGQLNLSCNSLVNLPGPFLNLTSHWYVLDLHSNQLQGPIPVLSSSVDYLDYSRNNFSSSIPADIGDFLMYTTFFSLASNHIHGIIPESVCKATFLQVLDLSNNSLSGMIPQCLTARNRSLAVLNLRRNKLSGTLPDNFPEHCSLQTLDLNGNVIGGQFPKSLANCTMLEVLNLGNNQITDVFPCSLKNISSLRVLVLRFNKFYDRIECLKTNSAWPKLQIIDIARNNFTGEIPGSFLKTWQAMMAGEDGAVSKINKELSHAYYQDTVTVTAKGREMELVKILTIFTSIDVSCNNFNGSIPEEVGKLKSLYGLNLSSNALTGAIPSSLGNLRQLESLDLSDNKLSGTIPSELSKLNFLSFLDLSSNQLVGKIPTGTQIQSFPADSFAGNKGLYGPPLDDGSARLSPTLEGKHSNSAHGIDWDLIGAEVGFIVGFGVAVGSLGLCKRWNKWYYKTMYKILVKIFPQLEDRIGPHRRHVHIN